MGSRRGGVLGKEHEGIHYLWASVPCGRRSDTSPGVQAGKCPSCQCLYTQAPWCCSCFSCQPTTCCSSVCPWLWRVRKACSKGYCACCSSTPDTVFSCSLPSSSCSLPPSSSSLPPSSSSLSP